MARKSKTADVLAQTADLLEKKNWVQGMLCQWSFSAGRPSKPERTGYCVLGAIWEVLGWPSYASEREGRTAMRPYNRRLGFKSSEDLAKWNDNKRRTKKTVIALLRRAAKAPIPIEE